MSKLMSKLMSKCRHLVLDIDLEVIFGFVDGLDVKVGHAWILERS